MNDAHANDEGKIMYDDIKGQISAIDINGKLHTMTMEQVVEQCRGDIMEEAGRQSLTMHEEAEAVTMASVVCACAMVYGEWSDYVVRDKQTADEHAFTCMLVCTQREVTITFKK